MGVVVGWSVWVVVGCSRLVDRSGGLVKVRYVPFELVGRSKEDVWGDAVRSDHDDCEESRASSQERPRGKVMAFLSLSGWYIYTIQALTPSLISLLLGADEIILCFASNK